MTTRATGRSLNETRLRVPSRSERFIRRPRISALLDQAIERPVTIVTGPAGTGKTLAVADWTRAGRLPGPPVWVSADRGDADVSRFWTSVVSAIAVAAGPEAFSGLEISSSPDADFLRDVARNLGGDFVLVLDDAHELDGVEVLDWLDQLLRWPPDGVRIVLVSRHDPPLALARLRLEGTLSEVRFADLAFTSAESGDLLAEWGVQLTPAAQERLMDTTGGWVAAIRLAAVTLRVADDPSAAIERFGGPTFLVSEYLWDEVLRLLPDGLSEFLLRTSIAGRICASLATALTGEPRSDVMLRTLAAEELLVQELEGTGWYRTHSLMTEVLRARLRADQPALESVLHQRAALWFESEGAWMESLRHALASGDWDFAGRLAARSAAVVWFGPERTAFGEALRDVPSGVVVDHPDLAAAVALAAYCRLEHAETRALTARAETAIEALPEPRRSIARLVLCVARAGQAQRDGDVPTLVTATAEAADLLSGLTAADVPGWSRFRGAIVAMQGVAELWAGRPGRAWALLAEAVTSYPATRVTPFSAAYYSGLLALAQVDSGDMAAARLTASSALEAARAQGRSRGYEAQWAWLALATVEVQSGDDLAAQAALAACEDAATERANPFVLTLIGVVEARRALAAGDLGPARRQLAEVESRLSEYPGMGAFVGVTTSVRVDLEITTGDPRAALTALAAHDVAASGLAPGAESPASDRVATARARALLAAGGAEQVRATVAHLLGGTGVEAAKAWLAVALAEDRLRHDARAIEALSRSLDLAADQGMVLAYLQPQPALAGLLRRHREVVGTHPALVERALATASGQRPTQGRPRPIEALTERERAVLVYLPTMGSNAEIAAALSISENTVKQHLKSIYRKLGVGSRRDAVRVAREHGLIPWASGAN